MANGIAEEISVDLDDIRRQTRQVAEELLAAARLEEGDILVVCCSSSEVVRMKIGTYSSEEVGRAIFEELRNITDRAGVYLAAQCCEHLNRSLIVEEDCARDYGFTRVNVVPQLKAGGSFASAAYNGFKRAWAVESLEGLGAAAIDIGDTLIGMHLRPVAVPFRTSRKSIGAAHVVTARTRFKYVGGPRASYDDELA